MSHKILDRIKSVIAEKRITQKNFAKGVEMSVTTANKLLNSEGDLSIYMIERFAKFLEVSDRWIITGKGSKYLKSGTDQMEEEEDNDISDNKNYKELEQKYKALEKDYLRLGNNIKHSSGAKKDSMISFLDSQAAVSYPVNYNNTDFIDQLPSITLPVSRFPKQQYRAFEINEDTMNQKIVNGDWAICEKVEDFKAIRDTYVYILVLEDGIQCRRVLNRIKERGRLRLKCDNKYFRDVEISVDQVKEVWEVKSLMTFSLSNPYFQLEDWMKKLEDKLFDLEEKVERGY